MRGRDAAGTLTRPLRQAGGRALCSRSTIADRPAFMPPPSMTNKSLTQVLHGKEISRTSAKEGRGLNIHFTDGLVLAIESVAGVIVATVGQPARFAAKGAGAHPTKRQTEYLAFIAKYTDRFGRPSAESDIGMHFLVSAPSVNHMMQTLERRGFVTRRQGVARSVRVCIELP